MQLEIAGNINDLRIPPGNRLEKLQGDLDGYYSLSVNDQWRIFLVDRSWPRRSPNYRLSLGGKNEFTWRASA